MGDSEMTTYGMLTAPISALKDLIAGGTTWKSYFPSGDDVESPIDPASRIYLGGADPPFSRPFAVVFPPIGTQSYGFVSGVDSGDIVVRFEFATPVQEDGSRLGTSDAEMYCIEQVESIMQDLKSDAVNSTLIVRKIGLRNGPFRSDPRGPEAEAEGDLVGSDITVSYGVTHG